MAHAFRRFIGQQLDDLTWTQADLERESGLSAQQVSKLMKDGRDLLPRMPEPKTISALAKAFRLDERVIRQVAVVALGVDGVEAPTITHEIKDVDDAQLIKELASRFGLEVSIRTKESPQPATQDEGEKTQDDQDGESFNPPEHAGESEPRRSRDRVD